MKDEQHKLNLILKTIEDKEPQNRTDVENAIVGLLLTLRRHADFILDHDNQLTKKALDATPAMEIDFGKEI